MASPAIEAFLRRAGYGVGQINARGSAIGSALQPYAGQAAGYYNTAQSAQSSLGSALQSSQANLGSQLGSQIGGALQGIQAPAQAVSQYGGGTAQTGQGAAGAIGGLSSADLQRLQSQGSAEQIYASALPRLAALAADQERRQFLNTAAQDLADLSAKEASLNYQRAIDERNFRYQANQDALTRKRQRRQDAIAVRQAKASAKHQALMDSIAIWSKQKLAQQADTRNAISAGRAAETAGYHRTTAAERAAAQAETTRHHGETEAEARARIAQATAAAKKHGKTIGLKPASEAVNRSYGYIMAYTGDGRLVPYKGPNGKPIKYKPKPSANNPTSNPTDIYGSPTPKKP